MAAEEKLEHLCTPKTLQRARQIASSAQDITARTCRFERNVTRLDAFVASSHGWNDRYRTSLSVEEDSGRIIDHFCTCPAHLRYDGPCKHCAALALAYRDDPASFAGYKEHRRPETTACLADLMRRTAAVQTSEEEATIDIVPAFSYAYHSWSVRFRIIGAHGAYVMKDIAAFVDDLHRCAWHSYGKNLAFVHSFEAFCPHGRSVAEAIDRIVSTRSMASRPKSIREIDLEEFELIDLLDIEDDAAFLIEGGDCSVRARTMARIVEGDPPLDIRIASEADGGASVTCGRRMVTISHANRLYLWEDEKMYRCSASYAASAALLRMLCAPENDELYIGEDDLPSFCAHLLPRIEKTFAPDVAAELDAYRPVPATLEFYFDKTNAEIECVAFARYGSARRRLARAGGRWEQKESRMPLPDEAAERRALRLVGEYFDSNADARHTLSLEQSRRVAELLFGGLSRFAELGAVFTTAAFDRLISDKKPRVSIGVSLAGDLIELDVRSDDLESDELAAVLASYRSRKRYHRLKNGIYLDIAELDMEQL
ncbi:MAG: SNF2 helicase associated domain-containing protein, partial [Slackia sp.]|nr:SNF2 helicase associated domain-containing protein [Slackia sp.]